MGWSLPCFFILQFIHKLLEFVFARGLAGPMAHVKNSDRANRLSFIFDGVVDFIGSVFPAVEEQVDFPAQILRLGCNGISGGHVLQGIDVVYNTVEPSLGDSEATSLLDVVGYRIEIVEGLWRNLNAKSHVSSEVVSRLLP